MDLKREIEDQGYQVLVHHGPHLVVATAVHQKTGVTFSATGNCDRTALNFLLGLISLGLSRPEAA
ncbi:MAG: hypothetical protein KDA28_07210 [Phycisphaerales bacterium]|nr:hypothetical protein [Phycisphaerales bacterium]